MKHRERELEVKIEGKNRWLSVLTISLTALVVILWKKCEYAAKVMSSFGDGKGTLVMGLIRLLLLLAVLHIFSFCVTCMMYANQHHSRKMWFKRQTAAYTALIVWDFLTGSHIMILMFGKEEKSFVQLTASSCFYFITLSCMLLLANFGFLFLPCWWLYDKEAESQGTVLTGIGVESPGDTHELLINYEEQQLQECGREDEGGVLPFESCEIEHTTLSSNVMGCSSSHRVFPDELMVSWDTPKFNERWEGNFSSTGSARINDELERLESGLVAKKKILEGVNWVYKVWDDVSEGQEDFRYSVWVMSGAVVCTIMLIYNMMLMSKRVRSLVDFVEEVSDSMTEVRHSGASNWSGVGLFSPPYNMSLSDAINDVRQSVQLLEELLTNNPNFTGAADLNKRIERLQHFILNYDGRIEWLVDMVVSAVVNSGTSLSSAQECFLSFLKIFHSTIEVGFVVGTLIGLQGVYTVLAKHKRMSLQLTEEIALNRQHAAIERQSRFGVERKYPIGNAVYFLGVMTSTALAQQTIFAVLIAGFLAIILNFKAYKSIMNLCGYRLCFVMATIAFNWVIIKLFGNKFLTDGIRVKRPRLFFLYMCTFSMMHFVLGFYYAVYRIAWLLATSVFVIGRLDITMFANGKRFDNGHKAFMSMLVLSHAIQEDTQNQSCRGTASGDTSEELSII